MVNSGSIIINSLLQTLMKPEMSGAEKFDEINNYIKRMAGDEYVSFNNSIFLAEREVSDRNYALSYYMKENKCFPKGSNIKDCIDFWYQVSNSWESRKLKKIDLFLFCCSAVQWKSIVNRWLLFVPHWPMGEPALSP